MARTASQLEFALPNPVQRRCFLGSRRILLLCVAAMMGTEGLARGDDTLVETLRLAHATWLRQVEFTSTYEVNEGEADSEELALEGKWKRRWQKHSGVFNKRGTTVRHSTVYRKPPRRASSTGTTLELENVPEDTVCGDTIEIHFLDSAAASVPAVAIVSERPTRYGTSPIQGHWMSNAFGPLCQWGGIYRDPLDIFVQRDQNEQVQRTAKELGNERVEVVCSAVSAPYAHEKRVVFYLGVVPPVVEFVQINDRPLDGRNPEFSASWRASDFVECPGGHVARVIRLASKNMGRIMAQEWISRNLGERPPTDADFEIKIPAYARVTGVNNPPPVGTVRTLSLKDFTLEDLKSGGNPAEPILATSGFPRRSILPVWGIVAVVGIVLVVLGYLGWRRLRAA